MEQRELMISAEDLLQRLDDDDVRVVDVRWSLDDDDGGRRAYEAGHIPGAIYLDWLADLSDPDDETEGQLAPPEQFAQTMSEVGIGDDTLVVTYDDNEIFMAPRLLWALHHYGHDAVRVLDGGFPAWLAAGLEVEEGPPPPVEPAEFTVTEIRDLRMTKEDVHLILQTEAPGAVILDCRMDRTWEESGAHIPGAQRFPSPTLVRAKDGGVVAESEIAQRAAALGADVDDPVVLYCGGGVSASAGYLALRRAGYREVRVYDGSWSEWSQADDVPIERH